MIAIISASTVCFAPFTSIVYATIEGMARRAAKTSLNEACYSAMPFRREPPRVSPSISAISAISPKCQTAVAFRPRKVHSLHGTLGRSLNPCKPRHLRPNWRSQFGRRASAQSRAAPSLAASRDRKVDYIRKRIRAASGSR